MLKMILAMALSFSGYADDEMKTETKIDATNTTSAVADPNPKPVLALDPAVRAKIRSKAPFWIDDSSHGASVRINKDGTFSSETQGGGSIAGSWKALKKGELYLAWGDGTAPYTYSVRIKAGTLLLNGKSPKKNRYRLTGAD